MTTKHDLDKWVVEALKSQHGRGSVVEVSRRVWQVHEQDLRQSGDMFYTWQYDIRWAAYRLRKDGILKPADASPEGVWELS